MSDAWFKIDEALVKKALQHVDARRRSYALAVYVVLKMHADQAGECFPGGPTICKWTGLSRPTVTKALRDLEALGVVTVDRTRKTPAGDPDTNLYYLPPVAEWRDEIERGYETPFHTPCSAVADGYATPLQTGMQGDCPKQDPMDLDPSEPDPINHPPPPPGEPPAASVRSNYSTAEDATSVASRRDRLDGFERFWEVWPKRQKRAEAEKAWRNLRPSADLTALIIERVVRFKASVKWTKDQGAYIPMPDKWLNGRRWTDEMTCLASPTGVGMTGTAEFYAERLRQRRAADSDPDTEAIETFAKPTAAPEPQHQPAPIQSREAAKTKAKASTIIGRIMADQTASRPAGLP